MTCTIKTDVTIIGAGISGLATAFFLDRRGIQSRIFEKQKRVGGVIDTLHSDGFLIELGPNSTLETTPLLHQLFLNLGIDDKMMYANEQSKNRYIVKNEKPVPLPMSPVAFFKTPLFSGAAKLRLLKEPFIDAGNPETDESLAQFVQRRLGQEFLDYAIDPFVAGVYAGTPDTLSVRSAFPKLFELEQKYGSLIKGAILGARERRKRAETSKQSARMFSFKNGMHSLIHALDAYLGEHIFKNSGIQSIRKTASGFELIADTTKGTCHCLSRMLILTIPSHAYPEMPFEFDFPLHSQLQKITYPPVTMVFLGYKNNPAAIPLDGFGFLIPQKERKQILGTIWSSTIFPNRAPEGGIALTNFIGGSRQPENALLPDAHLIQLVKKDLGDLMGIRQEPDKVVISRWEKAIPQYQLGHHQIIEAVEAFEAEMPGLHLSGNFRGGISVGDCIKNAHALAEKIAGKINITEMDREELTSDLK